jgi:hypothetical protein
MGEGWGDLFAIVMTSQATDDFVNGVFAAGRLDGRHADLQAELLLLDSAISLLGQHGQKSLTFKHISDGVALPSGPPRNPAAGRAQQRAAQRRRGLVHGRSGRCSSTSSQPMVMRGRRGACCSTS